MTDGDLTSLDNVKTWLKATSDTDDALYQRMITAYSRAVLAYIGRVSVTSRELTEYFGGSMRTQRALGEWPVSAISAVYAGGVNVPLSPAGSITTGYKCSTWGGELPGGPAWVRLFGYQFSSIPEGNYVTYTAGYLQSNESHVIPGTPYAVTTDKTWIADGGVTLNGVDMTKVTGVPTTGQYRAPTTVGGSYTFAAADTTATVKISYSFVPSDLEQAVIETIGERASYRPRIGQRTRSMGGQETASYDISDITSHVKLILQPYRMVLPLC